jgi:MOSC domain-containing protein YiiM
MSDSKATLVAIFLRPGARIPAVQAQSVRAVADIGLEGDHAHGGKRQVTLLSLESWRAACAELGRDLDPSTRRANLVISGLDLESAIGGVVTIGDVVVDVLGETRPCELMDDGGRTGLQKALRPQRRGGVYGRIRSGGQIEVGMECRLSPQAAS